jgi:hypothetical protein
MEVATLFREYHYANVQLDMLGHSATLNVKQEVTDLHHVVAMENAQADRHQKRPKRMDFVNAMLLTLGMTAQVHVQWELIMHLAPVHHAVHAALSIKKEVVHAMRVSQGWHVKVILVVQMHVVDMVNALVILCPKNIARAKVDGLVLHAHCSVLLHLLRVRFVKARVLAPHSMEFLSAHVNRQESAKCVNLFALWAMVLVLMLMLMLMLVLLGIVEMPVLHRATAKVHALLMTKLRVRLVHVWMVMAVCHVQLQH